jgi:hypothetical protein
MTNTSGTTGDATIHDSLTDYCIRVTRFVSNSALDPHLYFEKKLIGDVTVAETTEELLNILIGLIEWINETQNNAASLSAFDDELGRDGLPSLSLLCAPETRSVGLVLAGGRIRTSDESRLVEEFIGDTSKQAADREVAGRLLADYEQV